MLSKETRGIGRMGKCTMLEYLFIRIEVCIYDEFVRYVENFLSVIMIIVDDKYLSSLLLHLLNC